MQEYSKRLGQISQEQFQAALTRLHLGDFVKAEPIPVGLFGQNVFLTSSKGEFVFRGAPHYPWQFPTEQFMVNQLHEQTGVPVPFPYLLEPTCDIFGWSFVIMPRMPGRQVQDKSEPSSLSFHDRLEIACALARTLVEIQRLTWECAGKYDIDTGTVKPFQKGYREWIVDNIREKVAAAQGYNDHTTPSDVEWIESVIAKVMPVLHLDYQPCVVVGDYGEHNTVVLQTEGRWHISGVFDLMTAHFGDGQADLSLQVTAYLKENEPLADAFVGEYLRWKPMQPGFVELQQLYMLDLTMSFWRYWQKHQNGIPGEQEPLSFEQWARPSVDYWNKY
jgi:hygromycin-B 7''-O-kinase